MEIEWLIKVEGVGKYWVNQPTYIISQAAYLLAGVITLVHAFTKGGRWPYFWLGTVLHGLYADNIWHFILKDMDNFWHSQTPIMLLGNRLPLHIIFLYPAFMYTAAVAVSRLNLPKYAEPFAVALTTVLIDIPYDITAVKFVHWTWHDTDPNIFDRHYWVPWNSYYFHATFTASFVFLFQLCGRINAPRASIVSETWRLLVAVLLGMPGGVLLFIPIYHPLHDVYNIHSEVTFFMLFSIFCAITFLGLLSDRPKAERLTCVEYLIIFQLVVHYLTYLVIVISFNPENEISVGLHEPVGPCDEKSSLTTPFGQVLYKRKYFCVEDYDEGYFDFHCTTKPQRGATWYTICGTHFKNRVEYLAILSTISMLAAAVFFAMFFMTSLHKKKKNN